MKLITLDYLIMIRFFKNKKVSMTNSYDIYKFLEENKLNYKLKASTIYKRLRILIKNGFINHGIKHSRKYTYYITLQGIEESKKFLYII